MSKLARVAVVRIEVTVKLGSRSATIRRVAPESQSPGDERRAAGDGAAAPGTDGAFLGLSGEERRAMRVGWLLGLTIVAMIMVFDILTRTHNAGDSLGRAVVDEASSALVTAVVLALPMAITLWIRRRRPTWWGRALVYLAGAAVYPVLHVSGFVAIRKLAYAALWGATYEFGSLPGEFLYESAKDVPAFAFACGVFWLILRWRLDAPQQADGSGPLVIDIRDGARLVRAPLAEILAVRSAGNYAEFVLADGRRPLMRSPLSALEARLAAHGFVRTHRSWLVNAGRVTGLRPEGSGDYAVEIGTLEAPLSRRFPQALKTLRP
ncbi:MAG: LytTR family DNA-binding domain-containing protein [Phenylobacterium sp.]